MKRGRRRARGRDDGLSLLDRRLWRNFDGLVFALHGLLQLAPKTGLFLLVGLLLDAIGHASARGPSRIARSRGPLREERGRGRSPFSGCRVQSVRLSGGGGDRADRRATLGRPQGRLDDFPDTTRAGVLAFVHVSSGGRLVRCSIRPDVMALPGCGLRARSRVIVVGLDGLLNRLSTGRDDSSGRHMLGAGATTPPDPGTMSVIKGCPGSDPVGTVHDWERIPQDLVVGLGIIPSRRPSRTRIRAGFSLALLPSDILLRGLSTVGMIPRRTRLRRCSTGGSCLISLLSILTEFAIASIGTGTNRPGHPLILIRVRSVVVLLVLLCSSHHHSLLIRRRPRSDPGLIILVVMRRHGLKICLLC